MAQKIKTPIQKISNRTGIRLDSLLEIDINS